MIPSAAPPLGLLYLTSYLREYSGHQVEVVDGRYHEYSFDQWEEILRDRQPDVVGISAMSVEVGEVKEIAKRSRRAVPQAIFVVGGPYSTSNYEQALTDENIDYCVLGEGERTFHQLLNALEQKEDWRHIPQIAYRDNGEVKITGDMQFIDALDELPFPAYNVLDLEKYFNYRKAGKRTSSNQHQMKKRVLPIQTSRGCPFRCNYCHNLFGKKLRYRSIENVLAELREFKEKHGVEEVEILDDTFNVDLDRAKEIFRRIIAEKFDFKISFTNGLRADRFDDELLDLFKEAGVYRMVVAIESANPRIQKQIRKNVNLEKAMVNIKNACSRNFSVGAFFMIGFEDETEEEVWNTIKFAVDSPLHTATFSIMTPFPNTDVWHDLKARGYDLSSDPKHFSRVSLNVSKVPTERLEELRKIAYKKFYLDPRRVISILRTTPWRDRFFEKIIILFGIVFFNYEK
ncbi:B12-binding domain-containing radical SAM protein [bacterium]|nr:B12-binding domain-containing radical SAM protein [bacterium]